MDEKTRTIYTLTVTRLLLHRISHNINLVLNVHNLYSLGKKNWEIVVRYIPFKVLYPQRSTNITSIQSGTRAIHLLRSQ